MCGVCSCGDQAHFKVENTQGSLYKYPLELVKIEKDILHKNAQLANQNRDYLRRRQAVAVNLISSPGSGKTTLLVKTVEALKHRLPVAVIEGDQETSIDADRIRATGVPAVQINTGRGCHLDAQMVSDALENVTALEGRLLFIENIGNLVCPAGFDLGELKKIVILSVTEGDDKPLKYPDAFAAADVLVLSKVDLLPHVEFSMARCIENARSINPALQVFELSAQSGAGMERWLEWLSSLVEYHDNECVKEMHQHA